MSESKSNGVNQPDLIPVDDEDMKVTPKNPKGVQSSLVISATQSLLVRSAFWASVYYIGYLKQNVFWIALPLSLNFLWKYRRAKNPYMKEQRSKVSDLPTWIYFPDSDRAEWINQILKQLWPALQEHMTLRFQAMSSGKILCEVFGEIF